ncbi:hypothetical protein AAEX28_14955 [Lentisphaerota bacterium WC36G]|nr:hypothetical protein LJT99_01710 [Lentisphaerae bacterium WC36]
MDTDDQNYVMMDSVNQVEEESTLSSSENENHSPEEGNDGCAKRGCGCLAIIVGVIILINIISLVICGILTDFNFIIAPFL